MEWVKLIHITFVTLTLVGFLVRGWWMLSAADILNNKWVKTIPHIIDTGLLISGITLAYLMSLQIIQTEWLLAKIIALLVYIVFGTLALKRGRTKQIRIIFFVLALMVFSYIVSVAVTKLPQVF